jgi:hypothetical protein
MLATSEMHASVPSLLHHCSPTTPCDAKSWLAAAIQDLELPKQGKIGALEGHSIELLR